MNDSKLHIRVQRTAFGNHYRTIILPKLRPELLVPLLHVTTAHFKDLIEGEEGKIAVYRMGGIPAIEVTHVDLSWIKSMERNVLNRLQQVADWMIEGAAA